MFFCTYYLGANGGIMKLFHLDIPPKSPFGKGGLVASLH